MNQTNWITIIFGVSTVITGAYTFVTKNLLEQKEDRIKFLDKDIESLKKQVDEEQQKAKGLYNEFKSFITSVEQSNFDAADMANLQRVFGAMRGFENSLGKFEDCERAAEWLKIRKKIWAPDASKQAASKYKDLVPNRKLKGFTADIEKYLDWIIIRLQYHGGRTENAFMNETPLIKSSHPYTAAIIYIIELDDWGELAPMPRSYLREGLIRLSERIEQQLAKSHKRM